MKNVLVIGLSEFGRHLATKMQQLGNDVMIMDKNSALVEEYSAEFTDALIGDCTNENVIRSLEVNQFDICFVAIGEDFQASLIITSLLKQFGAEFVVAKANQDIQADLLKRIGADEIIYPDRDIAEKLAVRLNSDNIFDYTDLGGEYSIYEISTPKAWVDKTILDLEVRRKYHINIIAVKNGASLQPAPGAGYMFSGTEHIMVIGKSEDVFKITGK